MPKISVYLPDDLYREVRERNLPLSALTQDARFVRAGELTVADARSAVDDATALAIERVLPTATHLRRALALGERIRVLDGLYVAQARERRCPVLGDPADPTAAEVHTLPPEDAADLLLDRLAAWGYR